MNPEASERELIERALARPVSDATRAAWGFTNRTDMITLDNGQRVVLQRYRRREDAEYRLRVMRGLRTPAAQAGIPLPRVRDYNLDGDPAWVIYDAVPGLFAGRPVVLAHGDFAPVNVLTDGQTVTGLLDFEAVRLADPLFDAAWWARSVSFSSPGVLQQAWPAFLNGAGIDAAEPGLADRVRALQVLRMLEQLAAGNLAPGIAEIVTDRLRATLA